MKPTEISGDDTPAQAGSQSPSEATLGQADVTDALSSGANGQEPSGTEDTSGSASSTEPKTMAEAIEQALAGAPAPQDEAAADDPDADAAKPDEQETGTTEAGKPDPDPKDELSEDPTDEELAQMGRGARKRVKALLNQRHALKQEVTTLKPDADSYRTLRQWMAEKSMDDSLVANVLMVSADAVSGDPASMERALTFLEGQAKTLREALGKSIPDDLRPMVDTGEVTEEVARQMARQRFERDAATAKAKAAEAKVQTVTETVSRGQIQQAIQTWTTRAQATDPDFARKQDVMTLAAKNIVAQRGHPRTAADAEAMCQAAYEEANRILKAVQPAKTATRSTPQPGSSPNRPGLKAQPTGIADIINGVLG